MSREAAAAYGLNRAWFAQVRFDAGRSRVTHLRFFEKTDQLPDTLFVQTDRSMIQSINAETGQTLWVRMVGDARQPTMPVGANEEMVAVVNGTVLYILNRANGKILWREPVTGVPVDGPIMSDRYAFVPMISGQVMAYRIKKEQSRKPFLSKKSGDDASEEEKVEAKINDFEVESTVSDSLAVRQKYIPPMRCVSFGRITTQPILIQKGGAGNQIAWTTTRGLFVGFINVKSPSNFSLQYQMVAGSEIASPATFYPCFLSKNSGGGGVSTMATVNEAISSGLILVATVNGEVKAIHSRSGKEAWKYNLAETISEPVVPVGDHVYAISQEGNLFALEADSGNPVWKVSSVSHFLSASNGRLYVEDRLGKIKVINAADGAILERIRFDGFSHSFRNMATDRLFLASDDGTVVCLHETDQAKPIRHQAALVRRATELAQQQMATSLAKRRSHKSSVSSSGSTAEKPAKRPKRVRGRNSNGENPFGGQPGEKKPRAKKGKPGRQSGEQANPFG